jgi:hypothetical protein
VQGSSAGLLSLGIETIEDIFSSSEDIEGASGIVVILLYRFFLYNFIWKNVIPEVS